MITITATYDNGNELTFDKVVDYKLNNGNLYMCRETSVGSHYWDIVGHNNIVTISEINN